MRREWDGDRPMVIVEGGASFGPFLWGLAMGAGLALLLAPQTGAETRATLKKKLEDLRELAATKADELKERVAGGEEDEEPVRPSTRKQLERRLAEARAARRARAGRPPPASAPSPADEDDEPLA